MISGLGGDELLGGYPSFRGRAALAAPIRRSRSRAVAWILSRGRSSVVSRHVCRVHDPKAPGRWIIGELGGAYPLRRGLFCERTASITGSRDGARGLAPIEAFTQARSEPRAQSEV